MPSRAVLRRIDVLIWVCIFGGLLSLVLGLSVQRLHTLWGWLLLGSGAAVTLLGFVLWVVRARLPEDHGDPSRS